MDDGDREAYTAFFAEAEPRLRRALVAAYGPERGREATVEALAYAWQHWPTIRVKDNPVGYLYRVGQSRSRPRKQPVPDVVPAGGGDPWTEPGLPAAVAELSEQERLAVVLIEGFGWTYREVAELAGVTVSSVQSYRERALRKLRTALGVTEDA